MLLSFTSEFSFQDVRDQSPWLYRIQRIITRLFPLLPKTCFITGTLGIKSKCIFSWGLITCQFQMIFARIWTTKNCSGGQQTKSPGKSTTAADQTPAEEAQLTNQWNILRKRSPPNLAFWFCACLKKQPQWLMFGHYQGIREPSSSAYIFGALNV